MTTVHIQGSRPMQKRTRGRQAAPTKTQRRNMQRMLSELAEAGDTNAIGWLLALEELRRRKEPTC